MRFSSLRRSGFTLIELLVVITIIGILATGATATYTSQIQKARDTSRVNDLKALQSATEQYYQDFQVYPGTGNTATASGIAETGGVIRYASKIPRDQKLGQTCAKYSTQSTPDVVPCGYVYNVTPDDNNIGNGAYELSTGFENKGNVDSKAFNDDNGGVYNATHGAGITKDASRLEVGIRTAAGIDTNVSRFTSATVATIPSSTECAAANARVISAQTTAANTYLPVIICGNNN